MTLTNGVVGSDDGNDQSPGLRPSSPPPPPPPYAKRPTEKKVGKRKASVKEKLGRKAERAAALLYAKALRNMETHPAPHGYGDGYYECGCSRCNQAMRLEAAAEKAGAAWERAVALNARV